jgi:hypothetical protein
MVDGRISKFCLALDVRVILEELLYISKLGNLIFGIILAAIAVSKDNAPFIFNTNELLGIVCIVTLETVKDDADDLILFVFNE